MLEEYRTVAADADAQIEVKRSRFLARVRRVSDEAAARAVVEACRKQYWDARHHCSAFVLGPSGSLARSSDDGEPSGTAGAPILAAITGRGLCDVVVVVTRYFGGTLLGAGGLVRAYTDAAFAGLDRAGQLRRRRGVRIDVRAPLSIAGRLEHALRGMGVAVPEVRYGVDAVLTAVVAPQDLAAVTGQVAALTQGAGLVTETGSCWIDVR